MLLTLDCLYIIKHTLCVVKIFIQKLHVITSVSKDKQEKEKITDCVYKIPCVDSEKTYIGETGRKFGARLKEDETYRGEGNNKPFTERLTSLSERNTSALTDRAGHDNRIINWLPSAILDRDSDRSTRWIKETVHIRKEGQRSVNCDEGNYTPSHTHN